MLPIEIQKIKEETERVEKELFPPPPDPNAPAPTPDDKKSVDGKPGDKKSDEGDKKSKAPDKGQIDDKGKAPEGEPEPDADEKAEHKYSVLKGKYDKEVPKLHKDLRAANEQLLTMQSENAKLRTSIAEMNDRIAKIEASGAPESKKLEMLQDIENDPDIRVATENFPDVWKAVSKAIDKKVAAITATTAGKLEKVEADVKKADETSKNTADQAFYGYLDNNVQGWRDVNTDETFKIWLEQPVDKYSGRTKMELIRESIGRRDSSKVAEFFVDFAKEKEAAAKPAEPGKENEPAQEPEPIPEKIPVNPPKGRTAQTPKKVEIDKTTISSEHIADFYDKVRRGYYNGRQEAMQAEEKKIEKAVAEGRVV